MVVISGTPARRLARACDGCDVLVLGVFFQGWKPASAVAAISRHAHTSTEQLAGIATWARPKLLVLYHQLFWGATDDDLVREVRKGYAGAVVSAHDLDVFPPPPATRQPKKR